MNLFLGAYVFSCSFLKNLYDFVFTFSRLIVLESTVIEKNLLSLTVNQAHTQIKTTTIFIQKSSLNLKHGQYLLWGWRRNGSSHVWWTRV